MAECSVYVLPFSEYYVVVTQPPSRKVAEMYPPGSDDRDQFPSKHRKDIPWARNIPDKKSILQSHLQSYCQQTFLHGYQYLAHSGLCSRIFWSLIILSSTVIAIGLFVSSLTSYLHSRPMTTISDKTAPLSHLFFPSITLCNINQVRDLFLSLSLFIYLTLSCI